MSERTDSSVVDSSIVDSASIPSFSTTSSMPSSSLSSTTTTTTSSSTNPPPLPSNIPANYRIEYFPNTSTFYFDPPSMQNMPNTYGLHWVFMAFVVIIFLSVCGLNIFVYLAKGTQNVTDFIDGFLDKVHSDVGYPAFDILKFLFGAFVFGFNSALGTEAAVQVATKTVGTAAALASDPDDSSGNAAPPKKDDSSKQQGQQGNQKQKQK